MSIEPHTTNRRQDLLRDVVSTHSALVRATAALDAARATGDPFPRWFALHLEVTRSRHAAEAAAAAYADYAAGRRGGHIPDRASTGAPVVDRAVASARPVVRSTRSRRTADVATVALVVIAAPTASQMWGERVAPSPDAAPPVPDAVGKPDRFAADDASTDRTRAPAEFAPGGTVLRRHVRLLLPWRVTSQVPPTADPLSTRQGDLLGSPGMVRQ